MDKSKRVILRVFVLVMWMVLAAVSGFGWGQTEGLVKAQSNRQDSKMVFSVVGGSANVGGSINLKVLLTDMGGKPLVNQKVVFGYDVGWNWSENVTTNADGVATYNLVLSNSTERTGFVNSPKARYQMNAYFQGNGQYYPVEASIDFLIGSSISGVSQTTTSFHKTNVVEAIPFYPHGETMGDDGIGVPHGVLYYQLWRSVNYGFINTRSNISLPNGVSIPKPVIYGMYFFDSAGDQSPGNLGSYEIPASVSDCPWRKIPKYCDTTWQNAYLTKVKELGQNLDGKIDGVMVSFGYDAEANFVKSYSACENYLKTNYNCTSVGFQSMLKRAIDAHLQAFPNTAIFVQALPEDMAGAQQKGFGYKYNGFTGNSGEWGITYNSEYSSWMKYPRMRRAFESKIGGDGLYRSYWMILNMLNAKPDFIDFFGNHYPIFNKLPWFFDFVINTLGKDSSNTAHVWTVLRDTSEASRKDSDQNPLKGGESGFYGDFGYYLYRKENAPGSKTVAVRFDDPVFNSTYRGSDVNDFEYDQPYTNRFKEGPLPDAANRYQPIKNPPYTNYFTARKNAPGNQFMSFDVDNGWTFAGRIPDGNLNYEVVVVYLDNGSDSLSLEYKDRSGGLKTRRIQKTNTKRWIRTSDSANTRIVLSDAFFNDQMEGMTDFRINSNGDGDEIIHMLEIVGSGNGGGQPYPTVVVTPAPPYGDPTSTPRPTGVTPSCPKKGSGDANCDGVVNISDFGAWKTEFIQKAVQMTADFNGDGRVTIADFGSWKVGFLGR